MLRCAFTFVTAEDCCMHLPPNKMWQAEKEVGGETELKEASENWKMEIIKNLEP